VAEGRRNWQTDGMSSTPAKTKARSAAPRPNRERPALAPQRGVGRERVATLMAAASKVIQERGFDAATMAEIAARADTKIGSLYRFFPNKEVLADALMQRYSELRDAQCDEIDARARVVSIDELADLLVDSIAEIHDETMALVALLDARSEWSGKRLEYREKALKRIVGTLRLRAPTLPEETARDMAVVLLNNMKTMVAMTLDKSAPTSPGGPAELRLMNRLYLASKLAGHELPAAQAGASPSGGASG
jgi:AcrR family transcriptional regulator